MTKKLIYFFNLLIGVSYSICTFSQTVSDSTVLLKKVHPNNDLSVFQKSYMFETKDSASIKKSEINTSSPYLHVEQLIQGHVAGVNAIRSSGEPGVSPTLLIRGIALPFGKSLSIFENQPLYVVNGIPLLSNNNPYAKSIKRFDINNGPGSGIDITSVLDIDNIESIDILKGAEAVAIYGVQANNGAIVIKSKIPEKGPYQIALKLYGGVAVGNTGVYKNNFLPVNADFQRDLQLKFYNLYATEQQWASFPQYLSDSSNASYYGPSDWYKRYYKNAIQHGVAFNITGGNDRANFKFGVSERTNGGIANETGLKRYSIFYDMYMIPIEKLNVHAYVQANIARRDRNQSLRDRYAEEEFIPDLQYPLPVNNKYLNDYNKFVDESLDKNGVSGLQATLQTQYDLLKDISIHADFSYDYNDNYRDYFSPSTLSSGNSFVSYFTGVNRRITLNNYFLFDKKYDEDNKLSVRLGQSVSYDNLRYDYTTGYRGPSDYIKVIEIPGADGTGENTHDKRFVYTYKDFMKQHIASFYGNAVYEYKDRYHLAFTLRSDGSSYFGNGYWWRFSPSGAFAWDLSKENWFSQSSAVQSLTLKISAGRSARLLPSDYFGYGPSYLVDIGWSGNNNISSYATIPTLSMPYSSGYTGGGLHMPYTDAWSAGLDFTLGHILEGTLVYYNKTNKDLLIDMPVDEASGFKSKIINGMSIQNKGIEASLNHTVKLSSSLSWTSGLTFQYNSNKLLSLAGGLKSLQFGDNYLELGKPVDQFYLLQNNGIYQTSAEIPVGKSGNKLSYNGIPFQAGDPRWLDINGDNIIDDNDRVLTGHKIAPIQGGFNNHFQYKKWGLDFTFIYSFGNSILDANVANYLNITNVGQNDDATALNSIKEQTFWMARNDLGNYPLYNPWSFVNAYQTNQDLFLEKGGYLKLQSMSLAFDLGSLSYFKKKIKDLKVYMSAVNLFRLSKYSGLYPELSGASGYDYGYALPLPLTFTFGINVKF